MTIKVDEQKRRRIEEGLFDQWFRGSVYMQVVYSFKSRQPAKDGWMARAHYRTKNFAALLIEQRDQASAKAAPPADSALLAMLDECVNGEFGLAAWVEVHPCDHTPKLIERARTLLAGKQK